MFGHSLGRGGQVCVRALGFRDEDTTGGELRKRPVVAGLLEYRLRLVDERTEVTGGRLRGLEHEPVGGTLEAKAELPHAVAVGRRTVGGHFETSHNRFTALPAVEPRPGERDLEPSIAAVLGQQ